MDPAEVLGVPRGASRAEVHTAFRRAARLAHPDTGGDAESFRRITEAYEALTRRHPPATTGTVSVVRRRTARSEAARWVRRRIRT